MVVHRTFADFREPLADLPEKQERGRNVIDFAHLFYTSIVKAHTEVRSGHARVLPASDSGVAVRDTSCQSRAARELDTHNPAASAAAKTT
jgi:hypothetical protein